MPPPRHQTARVLIAGIGNIFLGDDAFGVEVVQRLGKRKLPEGVRAVDFGIRGMDLAYALLEGFESVILVDALPRGGRPGTLYVLEPKVPATDMAPLEAHSLEPAKVLRLAVTMGATFERLLLVGCEPAASAPSAMNMIMSDPVRSAIAPAVRLIEAIVGKLLAGEDPASGIEIAPG